MYRVGFWISVLLGYLVFCLCYYIQSPSFSKLNVYSNCIILISIHLVHTVTSLSSIPQLFHLLDGYLCLFEFRLFILDPCSSLMFIGSGLKFDPACFIGVDG